MVVEAGPALEQGDVLDAHPNTVDMSANRASLTREQQSWYLLENLWWVLKKMGSMNSAKEQTVQDIKLTRMSSLQEHLHIKADGNRNPLQRLKPAYNSTLQETCTGFAAAAGGAR